MVRKEGKLRDYIELKKKDRDILLMTHQIIGFPSKGANIQALRVFENEGVELVELQIPFSEPVADGPLFVKSNQIALESGIKVNECLEFAENVVKEFSFKVLIMTYYNIVFKYGEEAFFKRLRDIGVSGVIVPDIPVEEYSDFYRFAEEYGIDAISIATPYTDQARLEEINSCGNGFIYYVPRKGVTGTKTDFSADVNERVRFVKSVTKRSVAVGFGIQSKEDVDAIKESADIAVLGSKLQLVMEEGGVKGLEKFIRSLRDEVVK